MQVGFIMTDSDIKSESFLESINSMLATGEIPGLIPKDERDIVALECKNIFMKEPLACTSTRAAEEPIIPTEKPHARFTKPTMSPVANTA